MRDGERKGTFFSVQFSISFVQTFYSVSSSYLSLLALSLFSLPPAVTLFILSPSLSLLSSTSLHLLLSLHLSILLFTLWLTSVLSFLSASRFDLFFSYLSLSSPPHSSPLIPPSYVSMFSLLLSSMFFLNILFLLSVLSPSPSIPSSLPGCSFDRVRIRGPWALGSVTGVCVCNVCVCETFALRK